MKRILLCALAILASVQLATAQNKGEKYIGGSLGVSTISIGFDGTSASTTGFGIAPEFGVFVADRLRLGGSLAYNLSSSSGDTMHTLTLGPNLAYYIKLCDRFYYTPEIGIGFAYVSLYNTSGYGFSTGLSCGSFEFRPSTHCGLSFSLLTLQYTWLSYSDFGINGHITAFNFGVSPTIGFKYYF
ncbi:outer membrane beta-barrel protein [Alistipes sp.]|uniref:outer membrane beta-barrel protein n=1 Tax=Alistipes sp. TaxID=1872444 RepID=UPI0025BE80A2|nr:outer membrane beta-barrel protein [Alistipes sp.]